MEFESLEFGQALFPALVVNQSYLNCPSKLSCEIKYIICKKMKYFSSIAKKIFIGPGKLVEGPSKLIELVDLPSDSGPLICPETVPYPLDVFATVISIINNKITLCGGETPTKKCHAYSPKLTSGTNVKSDVNGTWEYFPSLQKSRSFAAGIGPLVSNKLFWWVTGGWNGKTVHDTTEKYEISSGKWAFGPILPRNVYRET